MVVHGAFIILHFTRTENIHQYDGGNQLARFRLMVDHIAECSKTLHREIMEESQVWARSWLPVENETVDFTLLYHKKGSHIAGEVDSSNPCR